MKKGIPFVDEARIQTHGGDGGNGVVSFRRERFVPKGGPDGGDGGDGGSVFLVAEAKCNSLSAFRKRSVFRAESGAAGGKRKLRGRCGKDLDIPAPMGTIIRDADTNEIISEVTQQNPRALVAKGGTRGFGNARFKSATNRAPKYRSEGKEGESRTLVLDLKLLADVALTGLPNAGKSSLLAAISDAKPKISDYSFTTLSPNRGVVIMDEWKAFVVVDLPGIIKGASSGRGLGDRFLKHMEKAHLLLHLCDIGSVDWRQALEGARDFAREITNAAICEKERWLVMTKCDLLRDQTAAHSEKKLLAGLRWRGKCFRVSIHDAASLETLKREMLNFIENNAELANA